MRAPGNPYKLRRVAERHGDQSKDCHGVLRNRPGCFAAAVYKIAPRSTVGLEEGCRPTLGGL